MSDLDRAIREYTADVKTEAARLIRLGVPPVDAVIQARQRIKLQRQGLPAPPHPDPQP